MNLFHRKLTRGSSGSSVDSILTPLKLMEKDDNTGEYIVHMSPEDFDHLSSQRQMNVNRNRDG